MSGGFEGWYYKHRARGRTLAIIPGRADKSAFVQVVTDEHAYNIPYPLSEYRKDGRLCVGENVFSDSGVTLDIRRPELSLTGEICYESIIPLRDDIMGPFRFFPMECRHGVVSMRHSLSGSVTLNGEPRDFTGGSGYIESDSGRSFPDMYAWVQCSDFGRDASVMASIARIPFCGLHFWGCICAVWIEGREYRLATYRGVKILRLDPERIELEQGRYRLEITVGSGEGHPLAAPLRGDMSRVIRERVSCRAGFRFLEGNSVLLSEDSMGASFEYVIK